MTAAASAVTTVADGPAVGPAGDLEPLLPNPRLRHRRPDASALRRRLRAAAYLRQVQLAPSSYRWMANYPHQRDSINGRIADSMACAHEALTAMASDGPHSDHLHASTRKSGPRRAPRRRPA